MQDAAARGIVSDGAPVICKPSRKVSVSLSGRDRDSSYSGSQARREGVQWS